MERWGEKEENGWGERLRLGEWRWDVGMSGEWGGRMMRVRAVRMGWGGGEEVRTRRRGLLLLLPTDQHHFGPTLFMATNCSLRPPALHTARTSDVALVREQWQPRLGGPYCLERHPRPRLG